MSIDTSESKPSAKSKAQKAREIAAKYIEQGKLTIPFDELKTKIMEEVPCGKSTAYKAIRRMMKKAKVGEEPSVSRVEEKRKEPLYLEEEKPEPTKITPIKLEEVPEAEEAVLLYIENMIKGNYVLVCSKDGILGEKYGVPVKQAEETASITFNFLCRRLTPEQLAKLDWVWLIMAHSTLVGGIAMKVIGERRKTAKKKEPPPSKQKKMEEATK